MQTACDVAPTTLEYQPAPQGMHVSEELACSTSDHVPAGQLWHRELLFAPVDESHLPLPQAVQLLMDVAPTSVE